MQNRREHGDSPTNVEFERSHYLYLQYGRRNSVEITGIPAEIETKDLEEKVINIFYEAGVKVHGNGLTHMDIQAAHRIGKKGTTIVKFTNRKFAIEGRRCGKNLKGTSIFGNASVYIFANSLHILDMSYSP